MILRTFFYAAAVFGTLTLFSGCMTSSSDSLTRVGSAAAYTVSGNTLVVTSIYFECADDGGAEINSEQDSSLFSISGSTLTLDIIDSEDYSAVIEYQDIFTRAGSGNGIQGSWKLISEPYQVVSGTLDSASKAELDGEEAANAKLLSYGTMQYTFTSDSLYSYENVNLAGVFVGEWNGDFDTQQDKPYSDSAQYEISIQAPNSSTVVLKGLIDSETVHVTFTENGDVTYASSDSTHTTFVYNPNQIPVTCAETQGQPDWWEAFLSENQNPNAYDYGVPKAAVKKKTLPLRPSLLFGGALRRG